jgi:hypothetical protein
VGLRGAGEISGPDISARLPLGLGSLGWLTYGAPGRSFEFRRVGKEKIFFFLRNYDFIFFFRETKSLNHYFILKQKSY